MKRKSRSDDVAGDLVWAVESWVGLDQNKDLEGLRHHKLIVTRLQKGRLQHIEDDSIWLQIAGRRL